MPEYIRFGDFDEKDTGHPEKYFAERYTYLDLRGGFHADPTSEFGFCNHIITWSHDISTGMFTNPVVNRPVYVEEHAWVTAFCLLYNCHISHHAIVAAGSVVRSMTVPPYTIVEGNPARVVRRWDGVKWAKLSTFRYG